MLVTALAYRRRITAIFVTLATTILWVSTSAEAANDYWGGPYADDKNHSIWYSYDNLGSARYNGIYNARIYSIDPTDVNTSQVAAYSTTTDVAVILASPDPNSSTDPLQNHESAYAVTVCIKPLANERCDQFRLTFNAKVPHSNYWSVGCHELGHSLGADDDQNLRFGTNASRPSAERSCLGSRPDWNYYSIHDKGRINAKY